MVEGKQFVPDIGPVGKSEDDVDSTCLWLQDSCGRTAQGSVVSVLVVLWFLKPHCVGRSSERGWLLPYMFWHMNIRFCGNSLRHKHSSCVQSHAHIFAWVFAMTWHLTWASARIAQCFSCTSSCDLSCLRARQHVPKEDPTASTGQGLPKTVGTVASRPIL
jgi:hypothetical protein